MNEFHPACTVWSTVAMVAHVVLSSETYTNAPLMYCEAICHVGLGNNLTLVIWTPRFSPMSIPTLHSELLEEYIEECSLSNAAYQPIESPHFTLLERLIVLFLASLKIDWVTEVTSFGTLKTTSEAVLDWTVPLSPLTLIIAPSPMWSPVTVTKPPLKEVWVGETT